MTVLGANPGFAVRRMTMAAILLGIGLVPAGTQAAVQGIGVSPTSVEQELKPGSTASGEITVINDGERDVQYKVYASDYTVKDESYVGDFSNSAAEANVSPVSWFTLPTGNYTVKSRQQVKFPYTITVPAGAAVGGHYGAIFIETIPPTAKGPALVSRVERIGTLFYLAVSGNIQKSGSVLPLEVKRLQSVAPVKASLRIANDGNVHFLAEGTAQLASPFGNVGKPVPFKGEVLPGTKRRFDFMLPAESPIGLYKVSANVKYLDRTETVSRWMLLMPRITFLVIAGTILLLVALLVAMVIRRLRRRA
jgi:hypothetical protein